MFDIKKQIKGDIEFELEITHSYLEEIKITLKKEFIGIDTQIDQLIEGIKPWLFFRDTLYKPLVINLWGLTGCGKTRLVERLIELLKLKNNSYRLNGSQLNEDNSLRHIINGHFTKSNYPIVIFDEFQNYRCKDNMGAEYEKYNGVLWDFMDNGMCEHNNSYFLNYNDKIGIHSLKRVINMLLYFNNKTFNNLSFSLNKEELDVVNKVCDTQLNNSSNDEDDYFINSEGEKVRIDFNDDEDSEVSTPPKTIIKNDRYVNINLDQSLIKDLKTWFVDFNGVYKIKEKFCKNITSFLELYGVDCGGKNELKNWLEKLNLEEFNDFMELIENDLLDSNRNITFDYSKALIFVLGNLDDAYGVHDNMNPDISADEFYRITKKVNIVQVKEALFKRFRVEHIARLGNTHIIYPSLNSKSYKEIISLQLNNYSEEIKKQYNFNLIFDETLHKIIYKEAVFPTLGVRNLITTINDMVKANVGNSMLYAITNNLNYDTIIYKYRNKYIEVDFIKDGKVIGNTKHIITFRVESLRDNKKDDKQALVAVHETGHAIMEMLLCKTLPKQIHSVTADTQSGGFTLSDDKEGSVLNNEVLQNKISLLLGGRAAEIVVFGNKLITPGAEHDLQEANEYLFKAYREWGMRNSLLLKDIVPNDNTVAKEMNNDTAKKVGEELEYLMGKTINMLSYNKKLLIKLSHYLSEHPSISRKTLIRIVKQNSNIDVNELLDENKNQGYKDILKNALKDINNNEEDKITNLYGEEY